MVEHIVEFDDGVDEQTDNFMNDSDEDELSFHHRVPQVLRDQDWNDVDELVEHMHPGSMDEHARQLTELHKHTILSKRRQLARDKLVMRASYKGHSYHAYPASDFERKSCEYLQQKRHVYTLVQAIDPTNPEVSQRCLADIVNQVATTLKDLLDAKFITDRHYVLMYTSRLYVQMNYLYFVPDTHQVGCLLIFYSDESDNTLYTRKEHPWNPLSSAKMDPQRAWLTISVVYSGLSSMK